MEPPELSKKDKLKLDASSPEHLRDHKPKNPYCEACQRAKMFHRPHGQKKQIGLVPKHFGDQITCDQLIAQSERGRSLTGDEDVSWSTTVLLGGREHTLSLPKEAIKPTRPYNTSQGTPR